MGNYVALSELKSALGITGSTDDDFLNLAIDAAEQAIDDLCGRVFTAAGSTSARTYRAQPYLAVTDDISTLTGLVIKTDTSGDGSFDQTWTSSDYQVEPLNDDELLETFASYGLVEPLPARGSGELEVIEAAGEEPAEPQAEEAPATREAESG